MMKYLPLLVLLALQAETSIPLGSPEKIMEKAMAKSALDSQILEENYEFDVVKNQKPEAGEKASNDQLTIGDLLGRGRYRYEMDDRIPLNLNGRPVYLVNFFPKSNQPNPPKGTDRRGKIKNDILNHLRGTIYVDQSDFGIVRVITHVNNPPERISIVGRLYVMEATLEQSQLGEIWVPKEIKVRAEFSYFLGWHRSLESTRIEFKNFRLKPPP